MFDSARLILSNYIEIDTVSRFLFYSIEMERGENPEDVYYLCTVKDRYFVVFETDYVINRLAAISKEAASIFEGYGISPLHWLVKNDQHSMAGASTIAIDAKNSESFRECLITDLISSPYGYDLRYGVMEFSSFNNQNEGHFHPSAYGNAS